MNLLIVKGLLTDYKNLVKQFFWSEIFSFEDSMRLKKMYDISSPLLLSCKNGLDSRFRAPLSLDCSFTDGQLAGITACAEAYHLFCVPSLKIEDMEALFACKDGFCIRVNNVRHVTVMFDALLENRFIQYHWQSVLEKGKFLLCKNGKYFVSASNLSTALSAARRNPDSVFYGI